MAETHITGPFLVGKTSEFGQDAVNGSSTAPLVSFATAPEFGLYVTSTARINTVVPGGIHMEVLTTAGLAVGSTGLLSTGGVTRALYIPQTTGAIMTSSGGGTAPTALVLGAALVYDSGRNKLCVYSTVTGAWMGTAPMTSS